MRVNRRACKVLERTYIPILKEYQTKVIHPRAYFHQFSLYYNDEGNYSVAIVELPDGTIILPLAQDIQFLEGENGEVLC